MTAAACNHVSKQRSSRTYPSIRQLSNLDDTNDTRNMPIALAEKDSRIVLQATICATRGHDPAYVTVLVG